MRFIRRRFNLSGFYCLFDGVLHLFKRRFRVRPVVGFDGEVNFKLWFCTRRAHAYKASVFQFVINAVGKGRAYFGSFARLDILFDILRIIAYRRDFVNVELGDGVFFKPVDYGVHIFHSVKPLERYRNIAVEYVTVSIVNFHKTLVYGLVYRSVVTYHFGAQHRGDYGVFVARVRSAKVSAALFEPEYERVRIVLFPKLNLFAYKLEAYRYFEQFYSELSAYSFCHTRRNERLDDSRI